MAAITAVRPDTFDIEVSVMDTVTQLSRSLGINAKVTRILEKRAEGAQQHFDERIRTALGRNAGPTAPAITGRFWPTPWDTWSYAVDMAQRSVMFWDTLRERGSEFVSRTSQEPKPVLHFDYETILDGRQFARPVNYALLKITPPDGVTVDVRKRPYLIIDPRAGHGPGIGGFKDDSQVGVALRAGHQVYFVIFFPDPEPGQTMLDVCAAEQEFVRKVRSLHPDSEKPVLIGNCQGGWAAMMIATTDPDNTGPVVINGAPMSYWSGAWSEGEGDNPMRYAGGMLGGTWLASFTADLGNGKFDGAHLVQNFESLNPANTFWDKYYHLFSNIDTEPPRFLDFERWWGAYYLMNREEIEWITRNLFVGNKLWSGDVKGATGKAFDLRDIRSPIILFASLGDNITPPQQAFNWVADLYGSTDEIRARGQVIVGLMHQSIGHLGIFVSGKVAKKEHAQIVSVLEAIESFAPGLYSMSITDRKGADGKIEYDVEFHEHQLEDIAAHFNRFKRDDEKPFEAVAELSDFNQRAYEMFAQPFVQSVSNEMTAYALREFHPLRFQRWAFSDLNPWLAWLPPAAGTMKSHRQVAKPDNPWRIIEQAGSAVISASLDYYRTMRDAGTEAMFFTIYANLFSQRSADPHHVQDNVALPATQARDQPYVKEALASIQEGGYTEALARAAALLARRGEPLPLSRLFTRKELAETYADYLPQLPPDQWRRIRGEQEIIVNHEPEQAIATLPVLLGDTTERERLLTLLGHLLADERVLGTRPTEAQRIMFERIRSILTKQSTSEQPAAVASHS
jgi:pimeloyl-ACP methyl ester carboxylesterase